MYLVFYIYRVSRTMQKTILLQFKIFLNITFNNSFYIHFVTLLHMVLKIMKILHYGQKYYYYLETIESLVTIMQIKNIPLSTSFNPTCFLLIIICLAYLSLTENIILSITENIKECYFHNFQFHMSLLINSLCISINH